MPSVLTRRSIMRLKSNLHNFPTFHRDSWRVYIHYSSFLPPCQQACIFTFGSDISFGIQILICRGAPAGAGGRFFEMKSITSCGSAQKTFQKGARREVSHFRQEIDRGSRKTSFPSAPIYLLGQPKISTRFLVEMTRSQWRIL